MVVIAEAAGVTLGEVREALAIEDEYLIEVALCEQLQEERDEEREEEERRLEELDKQPLLRCSGDASDGSSHEYDSW